jgi:hypothetical protein
MKIKLNLIPPSRRDEIQKNQYFRNITRWEFQIAVLILLFVAVLFSIRAILQMNVLLVETAQINEGNADSQKEIAGYDTDIKNINSRVAELEKIKNGQLKWENVFLKLDEYYVPGIRLETFATQNYAVGLSGIADTRDNLIIFKEQLAKEKCFTDLNLPLSSLVDKENVEFDLSFSVNKDCLKK